jgi:hypothetical protein
LFSRSFFGLIQSFFPDVVFSFNPPRITKICPSYIMVRMIITAINA